MSKKIEQWLSRESKTFSILCGEQFTNKEVVLMHGYILMLLVLTGIAGALAG